MENQSNQKRVDCTFQEGELVLLRLQPYRQSSIQRRVSHKLSKRYYGPFRIQRKIEKVAYHLDLPSSSRIHPVIHVSQLRAYHGTDPTSHFTPIPPELRGPDESTTTDLNLQASLAQKQHAIDTVQNEDDTVQKEDEHNSVEKVEQRKHTMKQVEERSTLEDFCVQDEVLKDFEKVGRREACELRQTDVKSPTKCVDVLELGGINDHVISNDSLTANNSQPHDVMPFQQTQSPPSKILPVSFLEPREGCTFLPVSAFQHDPPVLSNSKPLPNAKQLDRMKSHTSPAVPHASASNIHTPSQTLFPKHFQTLPSSTSQENFSWATSFKQAHTPLNTNLEDKVFVGSDSSDSSRPIRITKKPTWMKDYVSK